MVKNIKLNSSEFVINDRNINVVAIMDQVVSHDFNMSFVYLPLEFNLLSKPQFGTII